MPAQPVERDATHMCMANILYYLYINQYSFVVDVASLHTSLPSNIDIIKLRFAAAGWKGLLCLRQTTRGADNILVYINARRGRGNM